LGGPQRKLIAHAKKSLPHLWLRKLPKKRIPRRTRYGIAVVREVGKEAKGKRQEGKAVLEKLLTLY
jgi:hypothetical protein